MIIKKQEIDVGHINDEYGLAIGDDRAVYKNAIYLDLEHFIYRIPLCIGVFGACSYNPSSNKMEVAQYMIQNRKDAKDILYLAKDYFIKNKKKYIITFAGENDFLVLNFLFKKYKIKFDFQQSFVLLDLQKIYRRYSGSVIGLKELEKIFQIDRQTELISGANLARTFSKLLKEPGYGERISTEKVDKILKYNFDDVVNLFRITSTWNKYVEGEFCFLNKC